MLIEKKKQRAYILNINDAQGIYKPSPKRHAHHEVSGSRSTNNHGVVGELDFPHDLELCRCRERRESRHGSLVEPNSQA